MNVFEEMWQAGRKKKKRLCSEGVTSCGDEVIDKNATRVDDQTRNQRTGRGQKKEDDEEEEKKEKDEEKDEQYRFDVECRFEPGKNEKANDKAGSNVATETMLRTGNGQMNR